MRGDVPTYRVGDRVEYIAEPVFDGLIDTGEIGSVVKVERGWVLARWPRSGIHSVPLGNVRPASPSVARIVEREGNERIWDFVGEDKPPPGSGRERDPYMEQGCHPDVVERVWDVLGARVPPACRAQARGTPVLAHADTGRVFAAAHGTAYALWLSPSDYEVATTAGLKTVMTWSGGSNTDLHDTAGPGWVWGSWHTDEPAWVQRAYEAGGPDA